ncbi:uncharacterized protein SPPG_08482 [Spizellomyces punctatus DAOM BR117]|uniref:Uncharacterized protein n=1 Tax=Spizellomyces punctatus (strain DAOM BR117) TaxID=645134 RepID=A0A0L0H5C7_SPIPD|nr:uncharacterized protein SPPG_08482 [Spizellomyces punctatus DAOM BR117]KNC96096.1 hypothetical protein SPPG_08482 [Spizellomyces punctatus DAOM BR117]|eukprot:XP_016604136.1 hypothetical protein SPPG_08482 [Spizellomyces punctatus DAOM BR117]
MSRSADACVGSSHAVAHLFDHLVDSGSSKFRLGESSSSIARVAEPPLLEQNGWSHRGRLDVNGWGKEFEEFDNGNTDWKKGAARPVPSEERQSLQPPSNFLADQWTREMVEEEEEEEEYSTEWGDEAFTIQYLKSHPPPPQPPQPQLHLHPPRSDLTASSLIDEFLTSPSVGSNDLKSFYEAIEEAEASYWDSAPKSRPEWNWDLVFRRVSELEEGNAHLGGEPADASEISKRRLRLLLAQLTGSTSAAS